MPRIRRTHISATFVACALAASALQAQPTESAVLNETQKITALDGETLDNFGRVVAISGDIAVVGADGADNMGVVAAGAAYVYRFDGTSWNQTAALRASDPVAGDGFGQAVAISGDTIVVGVEHNDDLGTLAGAAYVYRFDGSNWTEEAKLLASDGEAFDSFGFSVAISSEVLVVGALFDGDNGVGAGAAYVYKRTQSGWEETAKLHASDGAKFDLFGISVSISSNTIAIGANNGPFGDVDVGSTYLFQFDGTNWIEQAKLLPIGSPGSGFGDYVAIDHNTLLVGAPAPTHSSDTGEVYIFESTDSVWERMQIIRPAESFYAEGFGASVSIEADTLVIGSVLDEVNGLGSGSAYIFRHDGIEWVQQAKLLPSDGAKEDNFGISAGVSSGTVIVGAWHDDDNGFESGSAYMFDIPAQPCRTDLLEDGILDIFDVFAFLKAWNAQDPSADWTTDGEFDLSDIFRYIDLYAEGCL